MDDKSLLNPKPAELAKAALAASTPAEANKLWFQAAEEMIGSRIILPMVSPDLILAHRKSVAGMRYSACCNLPLSEITLK